MNSIETVTLGGMEHMLEEIIPQLGFNRQTIYRGQASTDWKLQASLFRADIAKTEHKSWVELQARMMFSFKERALGAMDVAPTSELEYMAYGVHYGLPTHYTAWSMNALVALFYACDPLYPDKDGVVYRIMPWNASFRISQDYEQASNRLRVYQPRRPDVTMRNQRACFLAHPMPERAESALSIEEVFERGHEPHVLNRIIVPAEMKAYLRRRISLLGVDHSFVNPGLGGICGDLRSEVYYHTDSYDWIYPENAEQFGVQNDLPID